MANSNLYGCVSGEFEEEELQLPVEVKQFFNKYAQSGLHMTVPQLHQFMVEVQGETTATKAEAENILEHIISTRKHPHQPNSNATAKKSISVDEFFSYLLSVDLNPPINPKVHNDMTAPLSHYFIYTGHNSYLTGNQLTSDSSDVPIIQALQRGVRVIELDLWPTPNKQDVRVMHGLLDGKTLTSPVELTKCLKSIQTYAFCASPYPVILTLEDQLHSCPTLRDKVATLITQIFGDMLFHPKSEIIRAFPSPEKLKYKVIISTKPPNEYRQEAQTTNSKGDKSSKELPSKEKEKKSKGKIEQQNMVEQAEDNCDETSYENPVEYKKIIAIPGIKRGKVEESLKVDPNQVSRLSWSEHFLANATTAYGSDIVRYTQNNIMRIYPMATRVTSSNYNPFPGWIHGAQMVAFNMQGHGKPLRLMQGLFRANGGCGYVLKPDFLMKLGPKNKVFDPKADLPIKKTLQVKIYLGDGWSDDFKQNHFDNCSPPDFYVKLGIVGLLKDVNKKKTKVIKDRWKPSWNEEFSFPLRMPELALLTVKVLDSDKAVRDDFGGQTCLPVCDLRPGIHAVPLYDNKGEKYPSVKLLMQFGFQ